MKVQNNNPWLGLASYEEQDEYRFKGRENDIERMVALLQQNECVVCYAASGDGKSSLINAGVCPQIRKLGLFPIKIVFSANDYKTKNVEFDKLILSKINEQIQSYQKTYIKKYNIPESADFKISFEKQSKYSEGYNDALHDKLWWKLRTETIQIPFSGIDYTPVLIFDQFEEIFRADWRRGFFEWLEELSKDICPDNLFGLLTDSQINDLPSRKLFKTIVSLRSEYVGELDYWCSQMSYIPMLQENRYLLLPLNQSQAKDVITKQGVDTLDDVAELIIKSLKESNRDEVPAFLLSAMCSRLYNNAPTDVEGNKLKVQITDFNTEKDQILRKYYEDLIKTTNIKEAHIKEIEDCLVENGKRRRENCDTTKLQNIDFDKKYKSKLVEKYLIRVQQINGVECVEIVHDKIAEVISMRQKERKDSWLRDVWKWVFLFIPVLLFIAAIWSQFLPKENPNFIQELKKQEGCFELKSYNDITKSFAYSEVKFNISWLGDDYNSYRIKKAIVNDVGARLKDCSNLLSVEITDSVTRILDCFLYNCPNVKKIRIPKSVKSIDPEAFYSDDLILEPEDTMRFVWSNGMLWEKGKNDKGAIVYAQEWITGEYNPMVPFISEYNHHESLPFRGRRIYNSNRVKDKDNSYYANRMVLNADSTEFVKSSRYKKFETLDLSQYDKVTSIPNGLFAGCRNLKSVILPNSVDTIAPSAFENCENLESVTIKSKECEIYEYAFKGCVNLKKIEVIDSVTFDENALFQCWKVSIDKNGSAIPIQSQYIAATREYSISEYHDVIVCDSLSTYTQPIDYYKLNTIFAINPSKLENIYLWKANPSIKKYTVCLPEAYKHNIILHVPYGCAKNYISHPDYVGYKEIREDTLWQRVEDILTYYWLGVSRFLSVPLFLCCLLAILLYVVCCTAIDGARNKKSRFIFSFLYSTLMCLIGFVGVYWFCFLVVWGDEVNPFIGSSVVAVLYLLFALVVLGWTYRMSRKDMWSNVCQVLKQIYNAFRTPETRKKMVRTAILVAVPIVLCWQLFSFEERKDSYLYSEKYGLKKTVEDLYKEGNCEDATRIIAYGLLDEDSVKGILNNPYIGLRGLGNSVSSVCFSHDGNYLATGSDATPRIWEKDTDGKYVVIDTLEGHSSYVESVAFSPDGNYLATGLWDNTAKIWQKNELGKYVVIDTLEGHSSDVESVVFSPDGNYLATGSDDDTARIWQKNELGKYVAIDTLEGHSSDVESVVFSPDGNYLVTGSNDKTARIWQKDTDGKYVAVDTLQGHNSSVSSVAFSPDGNYLATGSWDNTARIWQKDHNGKYVAIDTLKGHGGWVRSVCFSSDGTYLATGSYDKTARIWPLREEDKEELKASIRSEKLTDAEKEKYGIRTFFKLYNIPLILLCIMILLLSIAYWAGRRNPAVRKMIFKYTLITMSASTFAWMAVAYIEYKDVYEHNIIKTAQKLYNEGETEKASKVIAQGLSKRYIENDSTVKKILGTPSSELKGHSGGVNSVCFSPDGNYFVTGSWDNTARIWQKDTNGNYVAIDTLAGHSGSVRSVAFSPDGNYLATGSWDKTARIWQKDTDGKYVAVDTLQGHNNSVSSVAFSPDGNYLATGSDDDTVRIWEKDSKGKYVAVDTLQGHNSYVTSVAFSPNGNYLATGSWDDTARIWQKDTDGKYVAIDTLEGHSSDVKSVAFSPDGNYLATGSDDDTVRIWQKDTDGKYVAIDTLKGHGDWVRSVCFSSDGTYLATGSSDKTARIWLVTIDAKIDYYKERKLSQAEKREIGISWWYNLW